LTEARHIPESTAPSALAAVICMNEEISPSNEPFRGLPLPFVAFVVPFTCAFPGARLACRSAGTPIGPAVTNPPASVLHITNDTTAIVRTVHML
jgi:hypothetical protein